MIFLDSNVLIDIIELDPTWCEWSISRLAEASEAGSVATNHVVLAEVAPYSGELGDFLAATEAMGVEILTLSDEAAYSAGVAFKTYRELRKGDSPRPILSDFLIGAHAENLGASILTRDPRFYRSYFPAVPLITPMKDD